MITPRYSCAQQQTLVYTRAPVQTRVHLRTPAHTYDHPHTFVLFVPFANKLKAKLNSDIGKVLKKSSRKKKEEERRKEKVGVRIR